MPNCNPCSWGSILSGDRGVSGSSRVSYLACTMMSNKSPVSIKVEGWYPRSPPPHTHSNRPNSPTPFPKLPAYCLRIATMSFVFFTSEGFICHHINDSCVCDHMHMYLQTSQNKIVLKDTWCFGLHGSTFELLYWRLLRAIHAGPLCPVI